MPAYLKSLKLYQKLQFKQVIMKDSRDITNQDREKILKEITKSTAKKIIITHGTYTMPITARYLANNLKLNNKIIILTGSMTPLSDFNLSDAPFNLGYAMAQAENLKPGVYVCMNGAVFKAEKVEKNTKIGRFFEK